MRRETSFLIETARPGRFRKYNVTLDYEDGRITFAKSPFALKDEIKAMAGARWHGNEDPPRKVWSVKDCQRNRFQLKYLEGGNPYEWFDQEIVPREYSVRKNGGTLRKHQRLLTDSWLTLHYHIFAAEMGTGKTLSALAGIEIAQAERPNSLCYWVGPVKTKEAIEREIEKWGFTLNIQFFGYEEFCSKEATLPTPLILVCDESSRLKNYAAKRTRAVQNMADRIRAQHGLKGFVLLMSGTPAPKTPVDWWAQAEIVWPGFLKEGSPQALEQRLAFYEDISIDGVEYRKRCGWKDSELKCDKCGKLREEHTDACDEAESCVFKVSINEVALLYERLKGLVTIVHKKDAVDLPDKVYRRMVAKPSDSTQRVALALSKMNASAAVVGAQLRELSDGFVYREVADGKKPCDHCETGEVDEWFDPTDEDRVYTSIDLVRNPDRLQKRRVMCPKCEGTREVTKHKRVAKEVPCPKEGMIVDLLDECEERGRIVIFAGFQGSIDRIVNTCHKQGWAVVRCDGRGWQVTTHDGAGVPSTKPIEYWADMERNRLVAFVGHPESGGMGLTLTESNVCVFYSNSFKPDARVQAEDRIHRMGMDTNRGATIVDLIHLPTDERVIDVIRENRRIELMTLGEFLRLEGQALPMEMAA